MGFLTASDGRISEHVIDQGNIDKSTRLNIYKNAYETRLKEVIDTDHNVLSFYLGDELFDEMVSVFRQQHPSHNTSLRNYADQLPQFLKETLPFSEHPIISEIATFERLLMTAFDSQDATRFCQDDLHVVPTENWPELTFKFHPSVQVFYSKWNSVESWQALKSEKIPEPANRLSNCWLLWRNEERLTEFRSLNEEELSLIKLIVAGSSFSTLCEQLLQKNDEKDVPALALNYLSGWLNDGILRNI